MKYRPRLASMAISWQALRPLLVNVARVPWFQKPRESAQMDAIFIVREATGTGSLT